MPAQADFDRVKRLVIDPIKRHFAAEFDTETIDDFVDGLADFSEKAMTEAMREIKIYQKRKPTLGHVAELCRRHAGVGENLKNSAEAYYASLCKRNADALAMAREYCERFKQSALWDQAQAEKWLHHLEAYVKAAAHFQAQLICQCLNPGYDVMPLDYAGLETSMLDRRIKAFVEDNRMQAQAGFIGVLPPSELTDKWRNLSNRREAA